MTLAEKEQRLQILRDANERMVNAGLGEDRRNIGGIDQSIARLEAEIAEEKGLTTSSQETTAPSDEEMLNLLFSGVEEQPSPDVPQAPAVDRQQQDALNLLFSDDAGPTPVEEDTDQADIEIVIPKYTPVPTTIDKLYYGGDAGQQIKAKEENARTILRMQSADPTISEKQRIDAKRDMQEVLEYKQRVYDQIQGDNITDVGIGKVVTNPDGTRDFVPGPYSSPVSQTILKTVSDTLRGLAGLPEAIAGPKLREDIESLKLPELIPEINSDNPYVNTIAEVAQLTVGSLGGLTIAAKAKKYADYASKLPRFKAFIKESGDTFADYTGPRVQTLSKGIADSAKTISEVLPTGTVPASLGAAAVADRDVATFFGDPDASIGEVKMQVLQESLLFGLAFNSIKGIGEITRLTPALKYGSGQLTSAISSLFAATSATKADEKVIEALGQTLLQASKRLANPENTIDDITRIQLEIFEEAKSTYSKLSGGGDLEAIMRGAETAAEGAPTLSEILGEKALMRLEMALMNQTGSREKASDILRTILSDADFARQQEIRDRVLAAGEELAPRGREAGEAAAEELGPSLEREIAGLETTAEAEARVIQQQTAEALAEAERKAQQIIQTEERGIETAQQIADETAESVKQALDKSNVSQNNLPEINNLVDADGAMTKITETLKEDLRVKDTFGKIKDTELSKIKISGEEAQGIVDDLIGTYTNPSFLVGDDAVQNAGKELGRLIRTFKSEADEALPPTPDPTPGPGPAPTPEPTPTPGPKPIRPMDQKLAELVLEAENVTDPTRFLAIAREIQDLTRRGARMPDQLPAGATPPPVAQEAAEEAVELPTITALDLEEIIIATQQRANKLKQIAQQESNRQAYSLGEGLTQYVNKLNQTLNTLVGNNPAAKEASENFANYFSGFKERWRSETGREWQGDIISSKTRVDIIDAEEKVMKVMTNPSASKKDRQLITEIVGRMPAETQQEFVQSIGTRLVADFASAKGVLPSETAEITVKQATQILERLNTYLNKNSNFEKALPNAFDKLRQIKADLESVVSPARSAQEAAKAQAKTGKKAIKTAEDVRKKEVSTLTTAQRDSLNSIQRRLETNVKAVNTSTVAKMLNVDDPTQYIESLFTKADGFKQYEDIWNRAGQLGEALPSGLTPAQEALQESVTFALLNKVYPTTARELADTPAGLKEIARVIVDPKSTPGRMFQLAFEKNPEGLEVLANLERTIASYTEKRSVAGLGARGSSTFEKQVLSKMVNDIAMVVYGPLTKDFRVARFVNRVFFNAFDGPFAVAEAFTRVLTDPRYSKMVIDKAAELAKKGLVNEQESFRKAFGATLLAAAGAKKYYQATDPDQLMLEDARQMAIAVESEEGLGAEPNPQ